MLPALLWIKAGGEDNDAIQAAVHDVDKKAIEEPILSLNLSLFLNYVTVYIMVSNDIFRFFLKTLVTVWCPNFYNSVEDMEVFLQPDTEALR